MNKQKFQQYAAVLKERIDAGDADAMELMGDLYYRGYTGTEQHPEAAVPYWRMALEHGKKDLAAKVGFILLSSDNSTEEDEYAGHAYLVMAAGQGIADAQFQVGEDYETGLGCQKDLELAKKYYKMAAMQNHGEAQLSLAFLLHNENNSDCIHWFCCAQENGVPEATEALEILSKQSPELRRAIRTVAEDVKKNGINPYAQNTSADSSGGCYVATAVYGSYDCPPVWTLRRFRDQLLAASAGGRAFIRTYYAVSPTLVRLFGETGWFRAMCKTPLDLLVRFLNKKGVEATPYEDHSW